jgi:hypothetical protein
MDVWSLPVKPWDLMFAPYILPMCGRVVQASEPLRCAFVDGLSLPTPSYNVAPSQELYVIRENHNTGERTLDLLRWAGSVSAARNSVVSITLCRVTWSAFSQTKASQSAAVALHGVRVHTRSSTDVVGSWLTLETSGTRPLHVRPTAYNGL